MSKTLPDFVSDDAASTPADTAPVADVAPAASAEAAPETPVAAEAETKERPRGPDGKFAPVSPPPAAQPEPQAAAVAETPPPAPPAPPEAPPPVPLATALEWRDRMAAAEKRAKELDEWRTQQEAQARRQPAPSFADNPAAAAAFQAEQFQAAMFEQRRDMSRRFAEIQHGKETVDAAFTWAADLIDQQLRQAGRSALNDDVRTSQDPVGFVVEQWRRDQIAAKVDPTKFEAFLAWEAAQAAAAAMPSAAQPTPHVAPVATPPAQPAAPRPSLAAAPSAASSGAPIPRDGAATYGAMFGA